MGDRERLIFVTRRPPIPETNGSRIRSSRLLRGLSEHFETTLVTFEHHARSPDGQCEAEELQAALPGVEVRWVPGLGPHKRAGQLWSLTGRSSWEAGRYRRREMSRVLRMLVAQRRPAIVQFDELGAALSGPLAGTSNVMCAHNVEYLLARTNGGAGRGLRRAFSEVEWRKIQREEERVWRSFPLCLAVSDQDAAAMRAGGARRVELCPNGADPVAASPVGLRAAGEPLRLLFVGSCNYLPYERGLHWMVDSVLPRLRERIPLALDIVGAPPRRPHHADGVTYHGVVGSVEPHYRRAHAVVVPVFEGSGTRLKIVEAAAHGRPVISTRLGAEGLPLQPGRDFLAADDPDAFADAVALLGRDLMVDGAHAVRLTEAARRAIQPLLWPRIVDRLVELYRDVAEAAPPDPHAVPGEVGAPSPA